MGRSRASILKRNREVRKAEKAAEKRARRHGKTVERAAEPRPTVILRDGRIRPAELDDDSGADEEREHEASS